MQTTTSGSNVTGTADTGAAKIEQLSSKAQDAIDRVAHAASSRLRNAGERGQEWMHHQDELLEGARECVRRHPVASVMIAVGVGILFSRFTQH
ncbi:MAG: hypothetical protein ROZ37_12585 [Aromatoleum sp.]|uniref:hypothetical protein n=1 Tax=Aromatoleum sp. TaxID=2307007 RepID=UPI0028959E65|nr:hypothetical protein [Aromatoleum sp.]MDT3671156.1 hypothetical protein [Aromatoleum sp.]